MLEIVNAVKSYGSRKIMDGLSIKLPESGIVCLFGPSGCGKTTLLNCVSGAERLDAGILSGFEEKKISCVFQEDRLLPWLSAEENIAVVFNERREGLRLAREWLEKIGLKGEEHKKPEELSGGMCRRVAIARALAFGGDLFLLDEPFQRLDAANRDRMLELVRESTRGALVLLVTHSETERSELADITLTVSGPPLRFIHEEKNSRIKMADPGFTVLPVGN